MSTPRFEDNLTYPEWCCLTCFHKFLFGKVMLRGGTGPDVYGNPQRLNCPNCRSVDIHPATERREAFDKDAVDIQEESKPDRR